MFGSPAEHLAGPIGIADNSRNVVGAISRGIVLDGYPDTTFRDQTAENVRYSAGHTRRDVEHHARLQTPDTPHGQRIGACNVAHVEEISLRIQVADTNNWRMKSRLDAGNLHGKCWDNEGLRLPGSRVVERPHADAFEPAPCQRAER